MGDSPAILILAALQAELAPVVRRLGLKRFGDVARGNAGPRPIIAATSGIGPQRMLERLQHLLQTHDVDWVVLVGFAGGLDPSLGPGTVIEFAQVRDLSGTVVAITSRKGPTLLTVDRLVSSPQAKRALHETHGAAAVDMESFAVARAMQGQARRLTVVRAISDAADTALPAESLGWVTAMGRSRALPAMAWTLARPWRIKRMWRLSRDTQQAASALGDYLDRLLNERVPQEPQQPGGCS